MDRPFRIGDTFIYDGVQYVVVEAGNDYLKARQDGKDKITYFKLTNRGWRFMKPRQVVNRFFQNDLPEGIRRVRPLYPLTPFTIPEMAEEIYSRVPLEYRTPNLIVNKTSEKAYKRLWEKEVRENYPSLYRSKPNDMTYRDYYYLLKHLTELYKANRINHDDILDEPSREILDSAVAFGYMNVLLWAEREYGVYPGELNQSEAIERDDLVMVKWLAENAGNTFDEEDIEVAESAGADDVLDWLKTHLNYDSDNDNYDSDW